MPRIPSQPSFARALRALREARGLTQEDFHPVSGRTYIGALERGIKQPTLAKVAQLAGALDVHPVTLLVLSHCPSLTAAQARKVLQRVESELAALPWLRESGK